MRGYAVAAGGWDEDDDAPRAALHVVADEATATDAPVEVVDLDAHRRSREAAATRNGGVILAW
jgi:hypothetical protein